MKTATETDLVWRALADPVRREILDLLAVEPRTTGHLAEHFQQICRTAVMKHIDVLVSADLVIIARSGRTRWNHLNPQPLESICNRWLNKHTRQMTKSLEQLKQIVESPL